MEQTAGAGNGALRQPTTALVPCRPMVAAVRRDGADLATAHQGSGDCPPVGASNRGAEIVAGRSGPFSLTTGWPREGGSCYSVRAWGVLGAGNPFSEHRAVSVR